MTNTTRMFIRMAGVCSIIAPLLMLCADLLQIVRFRFEFSIVLWLAFVFFVPAILGITYYIASRGSSLAVLGGVLAYFGAMAGASMQVLFRVWAVLEEKNSPQTIELLQESTKLTLTTRTIGLPFPIGLLILAACLYRYRIVNPIAALALAGGAILFPVGRIAEFWWAFIGSDILLSIAFVLVGWRLFSADDDSINNHVD